MKRYMFEVDYTTDIERFFSLDDARRFARTKRFAIIYKLTFDGPRVITSEKMDTYKNGKVR